MSVGRKTFKQTVREEEYKGVSPPALALPLLKFEILSENIFRKNVYLKVNGMASDSQGEKVQGLQVALWDRVCKSQSGQDRVYINPFLPTVSTFAGRETDVSRHNGGTRGAPIFFLLHMYSSHGCGKIRGSHKVDDWAATDRTGFKCLFLPYLSMQ